MRESGEQALTGADGAVEWSSGIPREVAAALDDIAHELHRHELVFRNSGVVPSAAELDGPLLGGVLAPARSPSAAPSAGPAQPPLAEPDAAVEISTNLGLGNMDFEDFAGDGLYERMV